MGGNASGELLTFKVQFYSIEIILLSLAVGNQSRCAEFNFFADPEAAYIVLNTAKCPITILPWEACLTDSLKISLVCFFFP